MGIMKFLFIKDITGYSYVNLVTSNKYIAVNVQCQHFVTLSDFCNTRLYSVTVRQTGCVTEVNSNISCKELFTLQLNNVSVMYIPIRMSHTYSKMDTLQRWSVSMLMKWSIDIFVYCNWVDTRWQWYISHLHTNNTQNAMKQNTQNITYIKIRIHKHNNKNNT
jgi:hypothetical protein